MDFEQRKEIEKLLSHGWSMMKIAAKMGLSDTLVTNEVKKCGGAKIYTAERGQERFNQRGKHSGLATRDLTKRCMEAHKDTILGMSQRGESIFEIIRATSASYFTIKLVMAKLGITAPTAWDMMEALNKRIESLENKLNQGK